MLLITLLTAAHASLGSANDQWCASPAGCGTDAVTGSLNLKLRNGEAQATLNRILGDQSYWNGAWKQNYSYRLYDEIRLQSTDSGYVPMITGEGQQDFQNEVVSDIVYYQNEDLPKYMSGCKLVVPLGSGYDPVVGAEYRDSFYILDLTLFYGYFGQRMYRKHDDARNQTVMWFEKLDSKFVDASTWSDYQGKMKGALDGIERRWPPFNSEIEVTDVYGMFVVEPGKQHTSRVSFVSKLTFDKNAGMVASWGSQLRPVVRAGLEAGFDASVAIAKHETDKRGGAARGPRGPSGATANGGQ